MWRLNWVQEMFSLQLVKGGEWRWHGKGGIPETGVKHEKSREVSHRPPKDSSLFLPPFHLFLCTVLGLIESGSHFSQIYQGSATSPKRDKSNNICTPYTTSL